MKITRAPTRKLAPLPATLATMVEHLVNDDQDQIKIWANLQDWKFPRSDLFQFVAVLNRFDTILETICQEYQLDEKSIQRKPFSDETKQTLLAILNLSKVLFENSTNRNLYNSYEHLNHLLNTTDIDILEALLKFMLKAAQRVNNPKAVQSSFLAPQDKITELARGGSITDFMSTDLETTLPSNKAVNTMSFYRAGEEEEEKEGLRTVNIITDSSKTDQEILWKIVEESRIPVDYHFELLNRIRIANHASEAHVRKQLLIIRFIAIVIMTHTMSETIAQNRVFIYDPHLVSQIAQLVSYDNRIPMDIQTYALYALDGIARHRTKVTEVLSAFNASANHGILLHILRQLSQGVSIYNVDFLDALFTLLSFLFQTQAGGQMLMSAGIMSTLIQIMDNTSNKSDIYVKVLIKIVGLLDIIMNNVVTSFTSFISANGLDSLLKLIQVQVDCYIERKDIEDYDSHTLVKNALRLLNRMMTSSHTADALRNLIESSLPHTLNKVMEHQKIFGSSVFSIAVHIITTFIHNEPTSLSVLQEINLPQTFLKTFKESDQANSVVLTAAVHAFGAICLNSAGLDMFNQAKPLPHFFKLMTAPSFVTNPTEVGSVSALGVAMDELIRHHPKLKGEIFVCANQLLQQVLVIGNSESGAPLDQSHQLLHQRQERELAERAECLSLGHVDIVSRFLEGFLGNTDNIKEFVNYGGPELLLSYYSLPMLPYNFSISNAFDSLSYVFRMISDVSPMPFAMLIMQKVYESSEFIFKELDHGKSVVYEYINANASNKERLEKGNQLFRKFSILFGYIGLLSTVFANAILTNGKNAIKLVEWTFGRFHTHGSVISLLGNIHRTMVWQNILLRDSVPKAWYNTNAQPITEDSSVDLKDPAVINVRRFKLLLSEIPPALMPVLQGIIKVSVNRRPNPSSSVYTLRRRAEVVAREIALVFKDNLLYMRDDSPICKYDYYASMFSMISMLLLDDRSRTALETPIAVAFDDLGNVDLLSNTLLAKFWVSAEEQIAQDKKSEEGSELQRINTCIELLLAILHHLGSSKLFHNSPHTTILTTADPDDETYEERLLNPYHWMASMQLKLSALHKYLHSPVLHKFSRHVLHSLLRCVTQNMKAEGEKSRTTKVRFQNIIPTIQNGDRSDRSRTRAALLDMGFDAQLTDSALDQFNGNGISALDYLFSRRLVEHAVNSGPPVLEISPNIESSSTPMTNEEFEAGVRILVNMWYDQALATEALRETNNLTQAALALSRREPSAIRTPVISASNTNTTEEIDIAVGGNDQDNDDEYEDIDSDEEESVDDSESDGDIESRDWPSKEVVLKTLKDLDTVRKTMRSEIPSILSHLVDERSDIDFEVRDLMVVLCCGDAEHLSKNTKQTIHLFFGSDSSATAKVAKDKRALFESSINKIRIFALMLREPAMQDVMSLLITTMSDFMDWFEFLDLIVTYPDFPNPKWLTTLFLILEAGLAQSDEPKEDPAPMVDHLTLGNADNDNGLSIPAIVTPKNRTTLMNYCINLLNMKTLSQDNLISTLRILVRLTKHHAAAAQFVALGGLEPLFKRPSQGFEVIKIQQAYIIMILRHILEDKFVLMNCMREWFSFWFTVPNSRFLDVATFIRNNNTLVLRDPETFLEVSTQLCRLSYYTSGNIKNIRYIGDGNGLQKEKQAEKIDSKQENTTTFVAEDSNKYSSIVVHFLLNQLVQTQSIQEETNIKIGYTGFLLQCLLEIISSYPSCKRDIIIFNSQQVSNPTVEDHSIDARIRQSILFTFVNKLLPFNAINPTTDQERKRQGISMWVSSLLVAMCYDTTQLSDSNAKTQDESQDALTDIRKHVLDVVYRSFKDALHPTNTASTSAKYIRYFALAELCHRILNARPASINPATAAAQSNNKEETVLAVAKLMLEKKFVPIFISVVSDVDVNYPHAKMILNSILRPLEQLTKLAIRIDRSAPGDGERKVDRKDTEDNENEHDLYLPMDTDEDNDAAAEEVSDIYRNSSLAMYDGTVLEEETSEDSSEHDDVEMASSGAEIIDDDEEDSSSGSDSYETVNSFDGEIEEVEVEVEEVDDEDEEVGDDEEMDELMRSHRFHHSDTEEEDENDSSDDTSDSNSEGDSEMSDSSSSYESSNESLNSDRSDSIHSEDSRDMAWHLDNLNNDMGFMPRHQLEFGHHSRRHREPRQVIRAEIDTDEDEDDMNIDQSESGEDQRSDDLNQEEIDDVERNLRLFASGNPSREVEPTINPTIRGPLGNNVGVGSGAGRSFDRDNIILHPLLRSTASPSAPTSSDGSFAPETAILSGTNSNHLQAYEDIIGGSAVRILENLLSQQQQRNNPSAAAGTENQQPQGSQSQANVEESASSQENKDTLNLLQEFQPMQTADRWIQEVQMVYISSVASAKAAKLTNTLVNKLIEIAKREKGDLAIPQERQVTGPVNEDENIATENEYMEVDDIDQVISDDGSLAGSSNEDEVILTLDPVEDEGQQDEAEEASPDEVQQENRVFVTINGEEIDITGTGIDAEFLEALPDDLRAEVLSQQMAERRLSIQSIEEDTISPEFLAALPPDIREEVIRQESFERNRRQGRQQSEPPNETDSTRSLPVAVNVTELNGHQMHPNLGLSGSHTVSDFNPPSATTVSPRDDNNVNTWRLIGRSANNDNNNVARKALLHKDAIRIVDRSQLAALARLLFVPQSISKALLNRLLLNLCENSKTRADLLSLLICILQDGSSDLAAVDRSFSRLSIHKLTSNAAADDQDKIMTDVSEQQPKLDENVPNLITQRCLEILYYVVTWNDRSLAYFLTENDTFGHIKRRHSIGRKFKNKDKSTTAVKYPILILIGLLDRPDFSDNTTLMGQLMNLLATMCRPFPSLVKRYKEKMESKNASIDNPDSSTTNEKRHHGAPKPPTIPSQYLQKIVDVLSVGECTSFTFQYTLSVLSYLSSLDGALETIIEGLISAANISGQQIIIDLQQLHVILENYKAGTELDGSALAQFSAATSHQTKLLRVLKAMDYLYTRKRVGATSGSHEDNEKLVLEIYNKLEFLPLWKMLGSCLSVIQDREGLINVATVLMPLVESFMAVSKYSTHKGGYNAAVKTNATEDFFFEFTEEHKKILNIMVRNNPSLMGGSFSLLVHNPKILEFDNKRSYFNQQLHKRTEPREHHPPLHLDVRRAHVFEDTYRQLQGLSGKEIKHGKLNVQFYNEEAADAGGVSREWFSVLARQMFDPNYALFITSAADKLTYQPNRASGVNFDHLSYFKCVGRIIGKAIHDGRLLDAYFTRSFYKLMLGRSVDYRDVEAVDPAYYKSLVWMLENDITDIIDLTFSVETDDFGTNKIIDLKPNGRNIPVTEQNKHEYVTLITEQKLVLAIKEQVNAFLEGFHDIIPAQLIQIFNEQELELLISGLPDIDLDEWKANTVYEGYTLSSPQIQWFWRAVRSFDQEERAKLLQFSTGTSKVPLEGFSQLQGSNGVQKFQIHKEFGDNNRLPSAHTCFNQIDLPQYSCYEDLRSNLFKAISECSTGFAFQ